MAHCPADATDAHTLNKLGFWPSVEVKGLADVITWRMMNLRSPELPDLEDKYQGRLRAERLGIPVPGLVGAWEHADDIPFEALPAQYVMKASHLAGAVAVMDDGRELIEDQELGTAELREMARGWLSRRYHSMQWAVWAIPKPMIMVEEMAMMHTSRGQWGGKGALDLKVLTVWGKVLLIYVATQDHGGTNYRMSVMLPTWNVTNFGAPLSRRACPPTHTWLTRHAAFCDKGIKWLNGGTCDNSRLYGQPHEIPPPRPVGIERLVKDAERMAEGIDILRVTPHHHHPAHAVRRRG